MHAHTHTQITCMRHARAHTRTHARACARTHSRRCDVLKLAMIKTERLAKKLFGGTIYDCVCVYEEAPASGLPLGWAGSA
jgi:hypothetical protein